MSSVMTREQYHKEYDETGNAIPKLVIDKVIDDFENRICKNCKHQEIHTFMGGHDKTWYCGIQLNEHDVLLEADEDFGCNRFTRKDDK